MTNPVPVRARAPELEQGPELAQVRVQVRAPGPAAVEAVAAVAAVAEEPPGPVEVAVEAAEAEEPRVP